MPSREGPDYDAVEIFAAVLLGLAAMAIAWSTYQSALWGGQQDEAYTESVREANNAVDQLQAADTIRTLDQSLFVEVLTSGVCSDGGQADDVACDQILSNMSDEGAVAVGRWLDGEVSNPFEDSTYLEVLYGPGDAARLTSDEYFADGGAANQHGDNYELVTTILTAVMFFAGISLVIGGIRTRWALLAVATLLFLGSVAYGVSLPIA
jgi:hypothetical protein